MVFMLRNEEESQVGGISNLMVVWPQAEREMLEACKGKMQSPPTACRIAAGVGLQELLVLVTHDGTVLAAYVNIKLETHSFKL